MAVAVETATTPIEDLELQFGGSLVEQLGSQLYPSATATVAELISNAWDADATHVWVDVPFEDWLEGGELVVVDDGRGMSHDMARDAYLIVGRKRRVVDGRDESEGGRKLHGRKGLGKLAAFGSAGVLECTTLRDGELTAFRLDYDKIRQLPPDEPYKVEAVENVEPLVNPETGDPLEHGTRIQLTDLRGKRRPVEGQFRTSMSRRFSVSATEMAVWINGTQLERFDIPVQFRLPPDAVPDDVPVDDDGWAHETVDGGGDVRWWIGFTEKPLTEEYLQGISILARGKMAQRPFKFERAQGTTGQLGQEYLVGEVEADWLDEGFDVEDDLIQSNRDQLQLEDTRLEHLIEWGQRRLRWALSKRNELRRDAAVEGFEASAELEELLEGYTGSEQARLLAIAKKAADFPEMDDQGLLVLMRQIVDAREDKIVRELMERIEAEGDEVQARMWPLVQEFGLIDARRTYSIIEARLKTIERLKRAIADGVKEVPDIHDIIKDNPWLLDPRWESLGHEIDLEQIVDFEPEREEGTGQFVDFLFALAPLPPAPLDEIVVVEIKRGTNPDGSIRKATDDEVKKFLDYVNGVKEHYASESKPPRVRGLMIANGYTGQGDTTRKSLETMAQPELEFRMWESVIEETERLHIAWLQVTSGRVERGAEEADAGADAATSAPAAQAHDTEGPAAS
jgi:hypothetical protein